MFAFKHIPQVVNLDNTKVDLTKVDKRDLLLAQLLCDFRSAAQAKSDRQYMSKSREVSELNGGEIYDIPMDLTVAGPCGTRCTKAVRHNGNFAVLAERDVSKSLEASELYCREADVPMDLTLAGPNGTEAVRHKGNFRCKFPGCFKSFATSKYLNQHEVSHKPGKYPCTLCNPPRILRRQASLVRHRKDMHQVEPYLCDFANCQAGFINSKQLNRHRSREHSKCFSCNVSFLSSAGLKLHLKKFGVQEEVLAVNGAKTRKEVEQNPEPSLASSADQQQPLEWIQSTVSKRSPSTDSSGYSSSPDLSLDLSSYKLEH